MPAARVASRQNCAYGNEPTALAARDVLVEIGGRDWDMAKIHLPELVREPRRVVEGDHDYLTEMIWNATLPPLVVVGMNPGKASIADPTVPRSRSRAVRMRRSELLRAHYAA